MSGWSQAKGQAIALPRDNVDTDQLIPARFMSTPRAEGYGRFLLHDQRFDADGVAVAGFPLNTHPEARILIAGRNFGSGSSREAAVYALVDFGFKAVVAPSFGDIFASNAVNNGLLPAQVEDDAWNDVVTALGSDAKEALIDLDTLSFRMGDLSIPFSLPPVWRQKLIKGWDDIDLTLAYADAIAADRAARLSSAPWTFPQPQGRG